MAERSVKGWNLGAKSYADPSRVELAARKQVGFDCDQGHHYEVTFASDADLPTLWDCPKCGGLGHRTDGVQAEPKPEKAPRTHWDMLLERRSVPELEDLLAERLGEIRRKRA